ncbi:MAG TPA: hypothetical protein VFP59_18050 [Candidatus Angelobacter sp.]|nr:hypothetical protein [Candidatus Angelobacter sp.]
MAQKRILDRSGLLAAIRRAAEKLGRAPTWNELRRLTGVPESRVRVYFRSLADAVQAAGLEPGRTGLKIATEDLLQDFSRVAALLGRNPSRNEYLRQGNYSAGAFYARFRAWGEISRAAMQNLHHEGTETRSEESGAIPVHPESAPLSDSVAQNIDQPGSNMPPESDKAIAMQWAGAITALPAELAGKRRVTDAFCAMIVGTLLGADSNWQEQLERYLGPSRKTSTADPRGLMPMQSDRANMNGHASLAPLNASVSSGGLLDGERHVMGPPFFPCALTNAPINELGVVFLFGMLAGDLGFQVESLRGQYPDCRARRQIQPGKWQDVNVELEYESLNFARHGHDPSRCDVIVCWRHNWKNCPPHIEVIELSRLFGMHKPAPDPSLCPTASPGEPIHHGGAETRRESKSSGHRLTQMNADGT